MHIIAAKAIAFGEALKPEYKAYMEQVKLNAKAMSERFLELGVKLVSGGTDNHLMLLDLSDKDVTGKDLERMLDEVNITLNKNAIPFDKQKPFVTSGVRIGTPAVTSRGFKEDDCRKVAELITEIINKKEDAYEAVRIEVQKLIAKYPLYEGVID